MARITLYTCETGKFLFNENDWFYAWDSPWEHRNIAFTVDEMFVEFCFVEDGTDVKAYKIRFNSDCCFGGKTSSELVGYSQSLYDMLDDIKNNGVREEF